MVLLNVYSTVVECTSKFSETAVLRPSINAADVLNLVLDSSINTSIVV